MENNFQFTKAERHKAKARIALCAPAGGGKTHSALLLAKGMGGTIALIDTENGSAEMEAGKPGIPDYDVLTITAPFSPLKYIQAIQAAEKQGYNIIIIDSLSHAWAGSGGLLDIKDKITASSASKNSYTAWRDITPMHNQLVDAMLQSSANIIATMRSKTEYTMDKDDTGRTAIKKLGLAPVQREGMDYEFTIVFDIDQQKHYATSSKDRTSLFPTDRIFIITEETGQEIKNWLEAGKEIIMYCDYCRIQHKKQTPVKMEQYQRTKTLFTDVFNGKEIGLCENCEKAAITFQQKQKEFLKSDKSNDDLLEVCVNCNSYVDMETFKNYNYDKTKVLCYNCQAKIKKQPDINAKIEIKEEDNLTPPINERQAPAQIKPELKCSACSMKITTREATYSTKQFKKILCRVCQANARGEEMAKEKKEISIEEAQKILTK